MAEPVHILGGLTMSIANGYAQPADSELIGYSAPPERLTKQLLSGGEGQVVTYAERPNAVRTSMWNVKGSSQDDVNDKIQAIEQELANCDPVEGKSIVYQYKMGNATKTNFDDIVSGHFVPKFDWVSDGVNWSRGCELSLHANRPYWRGARAYSSVNLLSYNQATLSDGVITGWSAVGSTIAATHTGTPRTLPFHLLTTPDNAAADEGFETEDGYEPQVEPGIDYVFAIWNKFISGAQTVTVEIQWLDVSGAQISLESTTQVLTSGHVRSEVTGTAPATAVLANLRVLTSAQDADTFAPDDMQFVVGTTATTYADPVQILSTPTNILTPNQASVETDLTGIIEVPDAGLTRSRSTTDSYHGVASLQHVWTGGAGTSGSYMEVSISDLGVGDIYTDSLFIKRISGADTNLVIRLEERDAGGVNDSFGSNLSGLTTTSYAQLDILHQITDADSDRIRIYIENDTTALTIRTDGHMLGKSATASAFRMPGPVSVQGSFTMTGDVATEVEFWVEPVGDAMASMHLGLHNQNAAGAPELAELANTIGPSVISDSTEIDAWVSTGGVMSKQVGTFQVLAVVTTGVAAADYKFRWAVDQTVPDGEVYLGPEVTAASQTGLQLLNLGTMTFPPANISDSDNLDAISAQLKVRTSKAADPQTIVVEDVIFLPLDNGSVFTSGVSAVAATKTLVMSSRGGDSISYAVAAGLQRSLSGWPSVQNTQTTQQSARYDSLIAGPGVVDYAIRAAENTGQLSGLRMRQSWVPLFYSPVQG